MKAELGGSRFLPAWAGFLGLAFLVGCGDGSTEPRGSESRLTLQNGNLQTDSILANLAAPLVVQVEDEFGNPRRGVQVQFGAFGFPSGCRIAEVGGNPPVEQLTLETDGAGRVSVTVHLGTRSGTASLPVTVLQPFAADTARFTITPGAPFRVVALDRALFRDSSFQLPVFVVDLYDNPRSDPVAFSSSDPVIASVALNGLVTGHSYGVAGIAATSGFLSDTGWVSVVPEGVVALAVPFIVPSRIEIRNLDGSAQVPLVDTGVLDGGGSTWSPDGQVLVYHESVGAGGKSLRRIPATGGASVSLIPAGAPFGDSDNPQFSTDGAWVYFRGSTGSLLRGEIWRIHPDGTGLERVGPIGGPTTIDAEPSPSPDGTAVAFVSDRGHPGMRTVRVLTLATQQELEIPLDASYPRWSPTGDWLALYRYDAGTMTQSLWLVRPDGSEPTRVGPPEEVYLGFGLAWSPDGLWLLATQPALISLLNANTGARIPLPYTNGRFYPAWRP